MTTFPPSMLVGTDPPSPLAAVTMALNSTVTTAPVDAHGMLPAEVEIIPSRAPGAGGEKHPQDSRGNDLFRYERWGISVP